MKDQRNDSHLETAFDDEFELPNGEYLDFYDFDRILVQAWEAFRNRISEKDGLGRDLLFKNFLDIIKAKIVNDKRVLKAKVVDGQNVFIYTTLLPDNTMQRKIIVIEVRDGSKINYNRAILFQFIKDKNELKGIYNDLQFLEGLLLEDKYEGGDYFAVVDLGQSDKFFVNIYNIIYGIGERKGDYYYGAFNIAIGTDRFSDSGYYDRTDKECQNHSIDADVRIPKYLLKKLIGNFCK